MKIHYAVILLTKSRYQHLHWLILLVEFECTQLGTALAESSTHVRLFSKKKMIIFSNIFCILVINLRADHNKSYKH